jgi:hypothetical protein
MRLGQTTSATTDPAIAGLFRLALRWWRLPLWAGLELMLGLVLAQLPLFGVLGYELALVATLVASIASLVIGASLARAAARVEAPALVRARSPVPLVGALWWRSAAVAAAVTAIPALVAAVHGLWAPTCDWGFGLRAYLSMVTTSAVLFSGAGVAIGLATAGARAWAPVVLGAALVLALALAGLWRFYSEPPVFTYDALIGYFPGNMYDEDIRLGAPLYWARLEELAWVIAALGAVAAVLDAPTLRPRWRERRPAALRSGSLAIALLAAGAAVALRADSGDLGYAVDADDMQRALGGRYETAHFVIYYAQTDAIAADIELIGADHELRLAQVAAELDVSADELARLGKIRSYYFASRDQKARLMGARDVEMAKPWRREIYVDHEPFPHPVIRHEIAHVVASLYGDPWFGVAAGRVAGVPLMINPGLVEGLAVALDWPGDYKTSLTPHQLVRALQKLGIEPSIGDVLSLGFLSLSSQRSYTTAGSFVRFLLDEKGPTALKRLYSTGGDFVAAFGESLGDLESEWRAMLQTVPISDGEVQMIAERFRHGSVFTRPCPHAVAARHAEAVEALGRGDRARAITLLREICKDSENDPIYLTALGIALISGEEPDLTEGRSLLETLAGEEDAVTTTLRASALTHLADADSDEDPPDLAAAEAHLARAAALSLDEDRAREIDAKLLALRHHGPAGASLVAYFFGAADRDTRELATEATIAEPTLGLAWYLRGLQYAQGAAPDHVQATRALGLALNLGLPSRRFERQAARMLAISAWRTGDRAAVARAADQLDAAGRTEVDHLLAEDWRDRLKRSEPTLFTSR